MLIERHGDHDRLDAQRLLASSSCAMIVELLDAGRLLVAELLDQPHARYRCRRRTTLLCDCWDASRRMATMSMYSGGCSVSSTLPSSPVPMKPTFTGSPSSAL